MDRLNFLVDLYLNMPDKGDHETPLHFACKFGFPLVIEVLAAHRKTDKNRINKYSETPRNIILSRCRTPSPELRKKIEDILDAQYYIPLYRSYDNSTQPHIGLPWSPECTNGKSEIAGSTKQFGTPKDPELHVRAYAGPMSEAQAELFHRNWMSCPAGSPDHVRKKFYQIRRGDSDKGLERLGRDISKNLNVPWKEYWEFLNGFVDLKTPEGLEQLNNYLKNVAERLKTKNGDSELLEGKGVRINHRLFSPVVSCDSPASDQDSFSHGRYSVKTNLSFDDEETERSPKNETSSLEFDPNRSLGLESSDSSDLSRLAQQFGRLKLRESFEQSPVKNADVNVFAKVFTNSDDEDDDDCDEDWEDAQSDNDEFYDSFSDLIDSDSNLQSNMRVSKSDDSIATNRDINLMSDEVENFKLTKRITNAKSKRRSIVGTLVDWLNPWSPRNSQPKSDEELLEKEVTPEKVEASPEENPKPTGEDLGDVSFVRKEHLTNDDVLCSTPVSYNTKTSDNEEETLPCKIFMEGLLPCKMDQDIYRVVSDIDTDNYPYIKIWKKSVVGFTDLQRNSWHSPAKLRRPHTRHTPSSRYSHQMATPNKDKLSDSFSDPTVNLLQYF